MELEVIAVGAMNLGESDRIVRALSADLGRVDLLVRHARSSKKRFAGVTEPGTRFIANTHKGKGSLTVLTSADLVAAPRLARQDLERIALLAYGCEICGALAGTGAPAPKLFRLLAVWLARLEDPTPVPRAARVALEAKALTFAGLTPGLTLCPVCGLRIDGDARFDLDAGGGVHGHCGKGPRIPASDLRAMEALRRMSLADIDGPTAVDGRWVLSDFIRHQVGRQLKSRALLEEVVGTPDPG